MTTHTTQREADERTKFEHWCIRKGYNTNKWHGGGYVDSSTQNGWEVWQACAAIDQSASTRAAPEAPTLARALREVRRQQIDPKLGTNGATAYERFLYAELARLQAAVIADCESAGAAPEAPDTCTVPPPGWHCTRAAGHTGPCAAHPVAPSRNADQFAINFIEQRAAAYLQDHADTEPGTGAIVFEFGEAGRDYHSTLIELADDIRAALAATEKGPTA